VNESLAADAIDDPSIPVLTERIFLSPIDLDTSLPVEPSPEPAAAEVAIPTAGETAATADVVMADVAPVETTTYAAAVVADLATTAPANEEMVVEPPAVAELPAAAEPATVETDPAPVDAATTAPPDDRDAFAESLRAAVMERLAGELPDQVNATVRELLQPSLDRAVAQLAEEAQVAMRIALQDLVDQAVREEVARSRGGTAR